MNDNDIEIRESYNEDTYGRKYHMPIVTKGKQKPQVDSASDAISFNMKQPMKMSDFSKISKESQIMYIEYLRKEYHATNIMIAKMLGTGNSYLGKKFKRLGIANKGKGGKRNFSMDDLEKWNKFLKGGVEEKAQVISKQEPSEVESLEENKNQVSDQHEVNCSECTFAEFHQVGKLDALDIYKKITALFKEGTECKLSIKIESIEKSERCE